MYQYCELKYIYVLKNPEDLSIRYVGQTVSPKTRFTRHVWDTEDTYKTRWLRKIKQAPIQEVIECCAYEEATNRENFWIGFYTAKGCRLTNSKDGNPTRSAQEQRRERLRKNGCIGVCLQNGRWCVRFTLHGKSESVGSFKNKVVAQRHYDNVARYYSDYPITNFQGTVAYSVEKAKEISRKINFKSIYPGITFDNEDSKFKVRVGEERTYVSSFVDLEEALYYQDRVALSLGLDTYKYHNEASITIEEVQKLNKDNLPKSRGVSKYRGVTWNTNNSFFVCSVIINGTETFIAGGFQDEKEAAKWHDRVAKHYNLRVNEEPDFTCSVQEAKLLIKKERTELGVIGVAQVGKRFTVRVRVNSEDHYIGIFPKIEDATYYSDAVRNYYGLTNNGTTSDKLSIEEAKAKIAALITPKGIRQKGKTWTVRINIEKQEYTVSRIKTKEQAIYISDALRNNYNLPNSQTTQDKLTLEEAKQLVRNSNQ